MDTVQQRVRTQYTVLNMSVLVFMSAASDVPTNHHEKRQRQCIDKFAETTSRVTWMDHRWTLRVETHYIVQYWGFLSR